MATVVDPFSLAPDSITRLELLARLEAQREQELNEARAIQLGMMPHGSLRTPNVMMCYDFQPFHEVGGDFLDFFKLTDGSIGIYLGDVTGKGLPAALYAALAVGTLRGVHKTGTDPGAVLGQLNRRMMLHRVLHRYAAVQYACLNPENGLLRISSAGMQGPLHLSRTGYRELQLQGIPPGLFGTAAYESVTVHLQPGDSVVFFSDGFSDTKNAAGDFFGMQRLQDLFESTRGAEPEELLQTMKDAVATYAAGETQQDDRTAAILRYTGC